MSVLDGNLHTAIHIQILHRNTLHRHSTEQAQQVQDRQTERQTERERDRETERQRDTERERERYLKVDRQTDRQ